MSPIPAPVRYSQNTLTSQHLFVNHWEEGSGHLWDIPFLAFVTTASVITPFFEEPMFWKRSITMVWILFRHSISRSVWSHYDIIEQPVWMERESKRAGLSKGSGRWEREWGEGQSSTAREADSLPNPDLGAMMHHLKYSCHRDAFVFWVLV